jgi:hypothetical protein
MEDTDGPNRFVLHFQTTAKAAADANALSGLGFARFDLIVDVLAMVLAVLVAATGFLVMGTVVFAIAALSLMTARIHPIQRALIAIRHRSLLGQPTDAIMDDEGFRLQNRLGSSYVPWSTVTDVRTNDQTAAFFRDRALVGYVPAIAFASPEEQARVVDFARSRVMQASAAASAADAVDPTEAANPAP